MVDLPTGHENDTDADRLRGKLKKLLLYRLLLALFFLVATIAVQGREVPDLLRAPFYPLYIFSCILFLFTIFGALSLGHVRRLGRFALLQLIFDLWAVTVLVYMTGGIESGFSSLYMLVILSAALLLDRRASLLAASACSLVYGLLLDLQYFGWISPLPLVSGSAYTHNSGTYFFKILINIAGFFLAGLLAGYLASELQKSTLRVRKSEKDLRTLTAFHTNIVRSIPSGLLAADLEGRIIFSNNAARKILGIKPSEIAGRPLEEIFVDLDLLATPKSEGKMDPTRPPRNETSYRHPAGRTLLLGYSVSALRTEKGAASGRLVVFTDLTRLRAIEERIQRSEHLVLAGKLAAEIAHEIKNPLAAMSGAVQMLRNETAAHPLHDRLMGIVQREIERVNKLVTEFLWLAKGSPQSARVEEVELCPVIEEIASILRADKSAGAHHTIRTDFHFRPRISMDPLHLHRVLWNLLVNALEAMPEGGELSICVRVEQTRENPDRPVRIDITDAGCGIPDAALKQIFDPFFTTKTNGTGLGLSIVYHLVEQAAGKVEVARAPSGTGTVFSLFFPPSVSFSLAK